MTPGCDCTAFSFREAPVSIGDVIRAALYRDELQAGASEAAHRAACEEEAARLGLEVDEDAVGALVDRFRYENDLISAEEAEAWLEARGLTTEEFQSYFERCHWLQTLGDQVPGPGADLTVVSPELLGELQADLILSGALGGLAAALSRRLISRAAVQGAPGAQEIDAERGRFLGRLGTGGLAGWLEGVERGEEWLERMIEAEAAYRMTCERVLTPERLERALAAARLPLTRLEVESVEFDSADAAREAHLCVRDDGLSLEEVARESRFPFRRVEFMAEDIGEAERQRLLCAAIGEVQAPAEEGGVFRLSRVLRKTEPLLADAPARRRVEHRILNAYFAEAAGKDVRWIIR